MELLTILNREDRSCNGCDPEIFVSDNSAEVDYAKKVCTGCVVKAECLTYALERTHLHGVWGGTTAKQRTYMRKRAAA